MLLTAALAAATGGYPLIIKFSFDSLLAKQRDVLFVVLGAVVTVTILRSLFLYLQTVASNRVILRIGTNVQKSAFAHLMDADFARLTAEGPGQRVSRLTNDVAAIQTATQATLNTAIRDMLSVVVLIATMIYLDPVMSLVVLCIYPLAALPVAYISQRLRKVAKQTQAGLGDLTSLLTEKLSAARLIKTFRLEDYTVGRVSDSFEQIYGLRVKALRSRARLDPTLEALGGIAVAGVIALAYWRISGGNATVGDFMGFVSALLMAAQPIRALGNLTARVQEGIAAVERVYEMLDDQPKIVDKAGAQPLRLSSGQIAFENVSFAYGRAEDGAAIRDLTVNVAGGTTVALVGRSGAGKSTLINLVPRLFDVNTGRIAIDDQDIRDVTLASLRSAIAIVSQDVTLFDDTIRANIALGRPGASAADIEAAAKAAAAHDFIIGQPNGYDTRIGDSGSRLSGGQRQRIALARAILKDAPILLLDEATSALDTQSERLVQAALAEFTRNRTTMVIAHRLSTVQNADLICVMDNGRIVEQGRHQDLLSRGGIYADLCSSQLLHGTTSETTTEPVAEP
ncbi:MAG: ABC transporter ATP-binding protein [Hyphomicrobiaceae bacterium]|nr:ABC transporter ATP-binding protein [Hyphomicrobiaceae bacterium]